MSSDKLSFIVGQSEEAIESFQKKLEALGLSVAAFNAYKEALDSVEGQNPQYIFLLNQDDTSPSDFMVRFSERALFENRIVFLVSPSEIEEQKFLELASLGIESVINPELSSSALEEILFPFSKAA